MRRRKMPVLRPWFWNLILLNLVAASCATLLPPWLADFAVTPQGCCACVGQVVVCRAASLHLSMLRQKVKNAHRKHCVLAPNPTVYLVSVRLLA